MMLFCSAPSPGVPFSLPIGSLRGESAKMQLDRDFPGPFYRKYDGGERWVELASRYGWGTSELPGAEAAWNLFRPEMLDDEDGLTALAHVREHAGGGFGSRRYRAR